MNKTVLLFFFLCTAFPMNAQDIRQPTAAGGFYPDKPDALRDTINSLLKNVPAVTVNGDIKGIIVPHAGYAYSGTVSARAYSLLKNKHYDAVVIIAPSHSERFSGVSIYPGTGLRTPLGVVPIARDLAKKLTQANSLITFSKKGYNNEHSIEVQLPFIQTVLPNTPVIPLVMGIQGLEISYLLAKTLAAVFKNNNVLFIASSDLSHFHPYTDAVKLDSEVIDGIHQYDPFLLGLNSFNGRWEACGAGAIVSSMVSAQSAGAKKAEILKFANSGDITGDKSSVVGYVSAVLTTETSAAREHTPAERQQFIKIAREAVEEVVLGKVPSLQKNIPAFLTQKGGAFVTLKINGVLRGCVGQILGERPLIQTVQFAAASAAINDDRFKPVTKEELPKLEYEISLLSPLRPVYNIQDIELGKTGLLLANGSQSGVFLPQVPIEQGWDRQMFLERLGLKAELNKDAWKHPKTLLFMFTAEVFEEQK
jgi:hypothetical protein